MPRQTTVDTAGQERVTTFTCDACERSEDRRHGDIVGSVDDSARVAGWIVGPGGKPVWCPVCTGKDLDWEPLTAIEQAMLRNALIFGEA